jgi:hypothetical protein
MNLISVILIMNAYPKVDHYDIIDWTFMMRKFIVLSDFERHEEGGDGKDHPLQLLDQQLYALAVYGMSRFMKQYFVELDKDLMIAVAERC